MKNPTIEIETTLIELGNRRPELTERDMSFVRAGWYQLMQDGPLAEFEEAYLRRRCDELTHAAESRGGHGG